MTFRDLERRLLDGVRRRLQQGEVSQRQLARLTGFTQPHVHNVLKGVRRITPELADALLAGLGISIADLLHHHELAAGYEPVPLGDGTIGPRHSFPDGPAGAGYLLFRASFLSRFDDPILLRVASNEGTMSPLIEPNDVILVDRSEAGRSRPRFESIHVLSFNGRGAICRCQRVGSTLVLVDEGGSQVSRLPDRIPLGKASILDIVRGKVVWIGRQIEPLES